MRLLRFSAAVAIVGGVGLLAGCGAAQGAVHPSRTPNSAAPSASESSLAKDPMSATASVDLECGQLDALNGILFRTEWQHDHGKISDTAYVARLSAVQDGWAYMLVGGTEVSPAIAAVQEAAKAGVSASDGSYRAAVSAASSACMDAGALVANMALPAMGG